MAAGARDRSYLRASHADRDQVIDVLKAAFVQGRLAKDEFDLRVGQALASRTYADLTAVTTDIPAERTGAQPLKPARQSVDKKAVIAMAGMTAALLGLLTVAMTAVAGLAGLAFGILFALMVAIPLAGLLNLHSWLEKRASKQPSQKLPPSAGSNTAQHRTSAGPAGELPQIELDPWHRTQAAQGLRLLATTPVR
jgi:hypothetical protein